VRCAITALTLVRLSMRAMRRATLRRNSEVIGVQ
jgi:hypothetical protein